MATIIKLAFILTSTLLINISLMLLVPFYPIVAEERGISEFLVGIVFTVSPLFSCLSSFFIDKLIEKYGCRTIACMGIAAGAISMLSLSFCNAYGNVEFLAISIVSRAFEGLGIACIYISNLTVISTEYTAKSEKYNSMMEAFGGLGYIIGPLFASVTYSIIGFSGIYFVECVILLVFLPLFWVFTPPVIHHLHIENQAKSNLKLNKNMFLDLSVLVFCYGCLTFLEPALSLALTKIEMTEDNIGLVFSGMTLAYTLTNFVMSLMSHYFDLERLLEVSAGLCVCGLLILGPIGFVFAYPFVYIIGVIFVGCGVALSFLSFLPSMFLEISNIGLDVKRNTNKLSSVFSIGMNVGEIAGPVVSGLFTGFFGFTASCITLSGIGTLLIVSHRFMKSKDFSNTQVLISDKDLEL